MSDAPSRIPGKLSVFLGYAAGVGKTYRMLEEVHQLKQHGRDAVVGYIESHGRQDTIAKAKGLEIIPRRVVSYRGHAFEEMDTEAILARRPQICAVDEFPHTNVPGSARSKRWEDVMVLLDAGIDVLTTMNVQHLESLNDQMREITGIRVRETIPDWVVKQAVQVVLIDLTPRALLNRLHRGAVYGTDKARSATENFFKEPTLAALREMALRQTAHEVEVRQPGAGNRPESPPGGHGNGAVPLGSERILIHITESPATAALIRRGRRVADYLRAECFAVCVLRTANLSELPEAVRGPIEQHLDFARKLHIETRVLEGDDAAHALVEFARRNGVTQIFVTKPSKRPIPILNKKHIAMRIVDLAKDMQVIVAAERRRRSGGAEERRS